MAGVKTNDGAIDIRPGRHCGRLWQVPVRQKQQREQHASDKGEVSTKGHAHHRVTTKPRGSLVQRGVTANVPVARPCRSDREKVEHPVLPRVADGIAKKPEEDTLKKFLMIGALAFAATTVAQTAIGRRILCRPRRHHQEVHGGRKQADLDDHHHRRQRHLQDQDRSRDRHEDDKGLHGVTTDPSRRKGRGVAAALFCSVIGECAARSAGGRSPNPAITAARSC